MDKGRFIRSTGIFLALSIVFSGVVGLAAASGDPVVLIPEPAPGDSAYYVLREVIDDPDIARGEVRFDWVRMSWQPETILMDDTGNPQPVHPMRYHLMFRQGTEWEQEILRNEYFDAADGTPSSDEWLYDGSIRTSGNGNCSPICINGNGGLDERADADIRVRSLTGPIGTCGVMTDLHGAEILPEEMEVPGYCRNFRFMGQEQTTTYRLVNHTVWNDRDAVVYETTNVDPFRLVYAEGIPFPVQADLPLSESIYEPYALGRHYEFELRGFEIGGIPYPLRAPHISGEPLPLVQRTDDIQIDETGMLGFTLRDAFDVAMADLQEPRLADFLADQNAYLSAAWKNVRVDGDGREYEMWHMYATDGSRHIGKTVEIRDPETYADIPDVEETPAGAGGQYEVRDSDYAPYNQLYPPRSALPDRLPPVLAAMERSTNFPGVTTPNVWGFYTACVNQACTQAHMAVRTGQENLPAPEEPATGLTSAPQYHQNTVFFGPDGRLTHTYSLDVEQGSPLLPVQPVDSSVPENEQGAQGDSVWLPPPPAAATSLGFLALLGAATYYFWPSLKLMGVGLFSRIQEDKVLDNPNRRRIHDVIFSEPGIHFGRLADEVGIGHSTLGHHLTKLEDAHLITKATAAGRTCYFVKGSTNWSMMEAKALLGSKSTGQVFDLIISQPGISASAITKTTGLGSSTVSYHLRKLREAGLVAQGRHLHPTELGMQAT